MVGRRETPPPPTLPIKSENVDIVDTGSREYWRSRHSRAADGGLKPAWAEAVALACAARPDLAALAAAIVPDLPYRMSVADGLKTGRPRSWTEAVNYAVERPYISFNDDGYVRAVVVDCDHDDPDRWRLCGLPEPTWIAETSGTGRHHAVWWLASPVYKGPGARMEPMRFLARVEQAMTNELDGDPGYAGRLTKNPFHPAWRVACRSGRAYGLRDLYAAVECAPTASTVSGWGEVRTGIGRNVELFDRLRFWAYGGRRRYGDRRAWGLAVAAMAADINATFASPLPPNEVGWTVKSVSNWVWERYRPSVDRGAMSADLSDGMALADRQRAAAARSADLNRRRTDDAIAAAIASLAASGHPVTQAAVAKAADVSLRTVKSRWPTIRPTVSCPAPEAPRPVLAVVSERAVGRSSGIRRRAAEYRRLRLVSETAVVEAERAIETPPRPGPVRPPIPAFLIAAQRLRSG